MVDGIFQSDSKYCLFTVNITPSNKRRKEICLLRVPKGYIKVSEKKREAKINEAKRKFDEIPECELEALRNDTGVMRDSTLAEVMINTELNRLINSSNKKPNSNLVCEDQDFDLCMHRNDLRNIPEVGPRKGKGGRPVQEKKV